MGVELVKKKDEEPVQGHKTDISLNVDSDSFLEIKNKLMNILFGIYEEIEFIKKEKKESIKIKEYIDELRNVQLKLIDNEDVQNTIRDVCDKIYKKLDSIKSIKEIEHIIGKVKELLLELDSSLNKSELNYSLGNIDIKSIVALYSLLNDSIKRGNLKEITASRGRLIRKLKNENKEINLAYENVEPLVKIRQMLNSDNISIEMIANELKKNDKLYLFFKDSLTDLDSFRIKFGIEFNKLEVQRIIFLKELLNNQLEKHKSVLNERYQNEFLDKKGTIPSIVTVLPNAVNLSIKKLANSIDELRQASNNRKKMHLIGDAMKSALEVVGTPVIYFGKFVASNWYTMYMAYKSINMAKQVKAEQEKKEAEEKAAQEKKATEEKKAAEEKALREKEKATKAREDAERRAKEKAENERKLEEQRLAREKAAKEAEEAEKQKQAEQAKQEEQQKQAEESKDTAKEAQKQTATDTKKQTEPAQDVDPVETIPSEYDNLRGSKLFSINSGPAYDGNIDKQLDMGLIDGDTMVTVTYFPEDAKWYEFWKIRTIKIPLKYVQMIWNWSPGTDLYNYDSPVQEDIPRTVYYSN